VTILTVLLIVVVGLLVGILSALLGVGGGIVMVPFMVLALGMSQQLAEGTSLVVIIPTALVGVLSYTKERRPSLADGMLLGAGGMVGAFLGARFALGVSPDALQLVFGIVLAIAGVRMFITGVRGRRARSRPSS
jgi:uncharacterized protein